MDPSEASKGIDDQFNVKIIGQQTMEYIADWSVVTHTCSPLPNVKSGIANFYEMKIC